MATHSSILAWTEESRLQSMGSQSQTQLSNEAQHIQDQGDKI